MGSSVPRVNSQVPCWCNKERLLVHLPYQTTLSRKDGFNKWLQYILAHMCGLCANVREPYLVCESEIPIVCLPY